MVKGTGLEAEATRTEPLLLLPVEKKVVLLFAGHVEVPGWVEQDLEHIVSVGTKINYALPLVVVHA